jgi:hypothetical protein
MHVRVGPQAACLLALVILFPSSTFADDPQDQPRRGIDHHWGVSFWGWSYHVDKRNDYNENNWGVGLGYFSRPQWWWLGSDQDNHVFLELDALRNSHRGLVLPLSAGVEYEVKTFSDSCRLFVVGAFTVAYYQDPRDDAADLKFGPVPGLVLSWGRVRTNMVVVLRSSKVPLTAVAGSMTLLF